MHFFQAFFSSKKCIKVYFYTEVAKKAEFFGPFGCSKLGKVPSQIKVPGQRKVPGNLAPKIQYFPGLHMILEQKSDL